MLSFLRLKSRVITSGVILAAVAITPVATAAGFVHSSARKSTPSVRPAAAILVQLTDPGGGLSPELRAAGARLVSPDLNVWRVKGGHASVVRALRAEGLLARVEPDRRLIPFGRVAASSDPLVPDEWWIHDVGDDQVQAPAAGVPVTVIDTGLDLAHE